MTLELCVSLLIYPSGIPDDTRAVCESVVPPMTQWVDGLN